MFKVRLFHANKPLPKQADVSDKRTLASIVEDECPSLSQPATFKPSPLVPGGHVQTIYAFLGFYIYHIQSIFKPKFTREILQLSDGGTVALDWALCDNHTRRPIITILSGVTGTSNDFYVRKCFEHFVKLQYSVVVIHSRGCGGSKLTTPLPFHCGYSEDYREVVNDICLRLPDCPLFGLSFSLGANIMAKYIGEEGENCPLVAAVIVGNPYDMYKVIDHLDSQFFSLNIIYDIAILNFLKKAFKENQREILKAPVELDKHKILKSSTIMEFTEEMTRKVFGYKSAKDLLDDSSSQPYLDNIRIPTLFLNALDDPICIPSLIPFDKLQNNPYTLLAITNHGGHIGYMGTTWPRSWIEHPVSEFLRSAVKNFNKVPVDEKSASTL